ncbi:hypothetical protein [Wolbachia pipientis]|uniref:hypothetical protein n=1 Tax=Wolbachia pipientis TaxID=955 RepID=UPI000A4D61A3|nr:hypothetical protein [Wolbachia pipientis]
MQQSHPSVSYLDDKKGSTGMTLSVVQFTFKNEYLYSYVSSTGMTRKGTLEFLFQH